MLQGTTLRDAIDQRRISILLKTDKIHDLIIELDPSGELRKKLNNLYYLAYWLLDDAIKNKDLKQFANIRSEAVELRREINSILETHYPKGPLGFLLD